MSSVQYLDSNKKVAFLSRSGAVITAANYSAPAENSIYTYDVKNTEQTITPYYMYGSQGLDVAPWGANNLKPNYLLGLIALSGINAQLIYTKVSFAVGQLFAFKWGYDEEGNPKKIPVDPGTDIKRYLNHRKTKQMMRARATDFFIHGNVWGSPVLNRGAAKEIVDWKHYDAFSCRLAMMNERSKRIESHYVCADWRYPIWGMEPKKRKDDHRPNVRRYPAFREEDPFKFYQALHHSKLYWSGQPYYGIQPWHSSHNWINYANQMPIWASANINRSFNIKYHIEYPDGYFDYLEQEYETIEERLAAKDKFFEEFDDLLAGSENAQTTLFTEYKVDEFNRKEFAGWKITTIKNDIKDDAFLKAFESSNNASTSSHWVDFSLAGIQFEGKMPASGSDKRISYQLHEVLKNDEVREIMMEPLYIMRDANGWDPDLEFGIMVRNIVTLAEDKSGMKDPNIM